MVYCLKIFVLVKIFFCCFFFTMLFIKVSFGSETIDVYGGYQTAPHSRVEGRYSDEETSENFFNFTAGWKGKSFSFPPYYGLRYTKWKMNSGWGLDFNHTKLYADKETLAKNGIEILQFTDGLNNLTFHRQIKPNFVLFSGMPYWGYGVGITIPHVEFQRTSDSVKTYEYQYGGPTVAFNFGIKYRLLNQSSFFYEYKFTSSWLDANLNDGGFIKSRIFTNALNLGISFQF